jgi:hypothetical protein
MFEKLIDRETAFLDDPSEKSRRYVTALVERNRGATASAVAELFVGPTLTDLHEPKPQENSDHLCRLEYRDATHRSGDHDRLNTHELRREFRLSVLQQHLQNFLEIRIEFIERASLRVRARETRNIPNEKPSLRVTLDHCGEVSHLYTSSVCQQVEQVPDPTTASPRATPSGHANRPNVRAKLPATAGAVSLVRDDAPCAADQAYSTCRSGSA